MILVTESTNSDPVWSSGVKRLASLRGGGSALFSWWCLFHSTTQNCAIGITWTVMKITIEKIVEKA
jgi:hypothetical protein